MSHTILFLIGDYMREICRSTDPEAEIVRDHIKNAKLLPGEIMLPLLQRKMKKEQCEGGYRAVLVDGFPRDFAQAISFEETDKAKQRFLNRKLPERPEDTDDMFEKRYRQHEENNARIVNYYHEAGILEETPFRSALDMHPATVGRLRRSTIEVERKFRCSDKSIEQFRRNTGSPPFRRLDHLGKRSFEDAYFDRNKILSTNGIWVRQRNGQWQAKVRPDAKQGSFTNSQFEEFTKASQIAQMIRRYIDPSLVSSTGADNFGLAQIARFTTYREMWKVDDKFDVVFDRTDFGHVVGEVELECEIQVDDDDGRSLVQKQAAIAEMDGEIGLFMRQYSWAFPIAIDARCRRIGEWHAGQIPQQRRHVYYAALRSESSRSVPRQSIVIPHEGKCAVTQDTQRCQEEPFDPGENDAKTVYRSGFGGSLLFAATAYTTGHGPHLIVIIIVSSLPVRVPRGTGQVVVSSAPPALTVLLCGIRAAAFLFFANDANHNCSMFRGTCHVFRLWIPLGARTCTIVAEDQADAAKAAHARRREQVRRAQRCIGASNHRERKETYIKALEQEFRTLRNEEDSIVMETQKVADENKMLRDIMRANGLAFPGKPLAPGSQNRPPTIVKVIGDPGADQRLQVAVDGASDIPRIFPPDNMSPDDRKTTSSDHTTASPQPNIKHESPQSLSQSPQDQTVGPNHCNHGSHPLPSIKHPLGLDSTQVGVDFVLFLERHCLQHARTSCAKSPFSGHVLTFQTPLLANGPATLHDNDTWEIPACHLDRLFELAGALDLAGDITPVQAWNRIRQHPSFHKLDAESLRNLTVLLKKDVQCFGFGAVIDEELFNMYLEQTFHSL
ncbi:predicted protein [Uncinocarpus reesii 1704]|uniref:Thiamine-triphosphatase n=1 Tax=Uncinocarpus reesii (strain UAMH 1704) TaxID=336963 RepID=C4JQN0_UNCRE|nr:uncharacterized protein UREG_03375 [Uncinocarpus reesii 1704]EEP78529.1 predicted protein [Uncinocarpus reesii 1704]